MSERSKRQNVAERLRMAREFLEGLFERMGADVEVTLKYLPEGPTFDITGRDAGMIIGRHGRTLASIQFLVNLIVSKKFSNRDELRIYLDSKGYRARREQQLRDIAVKAANQVKRSGKPVKLQRMLPHERRVIHLTLSEDPEVITFSIGKNPYKQVVVAPADLTPEEVESMLSEHERGR